MQKICFIFLVSLFLAQFSIAQQNNIWYFGRQAALDFNGSSPDPLHNSVMSADEGSASICDNAGNLLFYTNGLTVYNKNHQVMLGGTGLAGNISTTQTLIVPLPGSTTIYYIFTADAVENNFANGYNYSVVDMSRDGGKGEVISKNVLFSSDCTEKITAARHADGISVWVITNDKNSNVFRAWLMGCNGFSNVPVVSAVGNILASNNTMNIGMMKVSPDSKLLCHTHFPYLDDGTGVITPNFFQLFDFNNTTGILSNARVINPGDARYTSCDFSSNSRMVYVSRAYEKKIDQYECTLPTAGAILASRFTIDTEGASFYGIQLAPDEKIYLATPSLFLGAINYPNVKGAGCLFRKEQLDISEGIGGSAYAGLPSFINDLSFDGSNNFDYLILDSCTGNVRFNAFTTIPGGASYTWDFGDGGISTLQNPVHSFSSSASVYTVRLKIQPNNGCGSIERVKKLRPKGIQLSPAFSFKIVCDSSLVRFTNLTTFTPDTAFIRYNWDFGDGNSSTQANPTHVYAPGSYNVRLTIQTTTACLNAFVNQTVAINSVTVQAPADQEIDMGQIVQLSAMGTGGTRYVWSPSTGLSNPAIPNPVAKPRKSTTYIVTAFNDGGCSAMDSVFIKVITVPGIKVPTGFTPNNDGKNDIMRPYVADEYILNEFAIYNRWGQKVYSTSQKEAGWNGKLGGLMQDAGVYVYTIIVTDIVTNLKEEMKGTFILIH